MGGPTGVGKSRTAIALAQSIGGEIVNYDSVQIYRGFDIGSAKPSAEERSIVPHHLFDVAEATDTFTAADFAALASEVCRAISKRGRHPVLVGGTGFYLRALLSGLPDLPPRDAPLRARMATIRKKPRGAQHLHAALRRVDPAAAAKIPPADTHRVERALEVYLLTGTPISSHARPTATAVRRPALQFALSLPRPMLHEIVDRRVDEMYAAGLVEETRELLERYPPDARPFTSIGYAEAVRVVRGELGLEEAKLETKRRTKAYAKRQMTWFRSDPSVIWIDASASLQSIVAGIVTAVDEREAEGSWGI